MYKFKLIWAYVIHTCSLFTFFYLADSHFITKTHRHIQKLDKCIAYRAPYKLVKEWLICDKLAYIYRNFFYFFKSGIIFENTLKLFKNMPEIFQRWFKNLNTDFWCRTEFQKIRISSRFCTDFSFFSSIFSIFLSNFL